MRAVHPYLVAAAIVAALSVPAPARAEQSSQQSPLLSTSDPAPEPSPPPKDESADPAQAGTVPATDQTGRDVHPTPQHTGFQALIRTTGSDFVAFPKRPSTWVILGVGAGLAGLAHPVDDDVNARLVGSRNVGRFFAPGKFLGAAYTQVGVSVGLYAIGRFMLPAAEGTARTNKVSHLGYDLLRAQIVSQTIVQGMKYAVRRDRPTGECCGFPSGHAATAFAVAAVLERHKGYRFAWPTVAAASYVALSRLHDNRHFLSDVLFGSAIGTATGWTIVGRHGRDSYALVPTPVRGGFAFAVTKVPAKL
jgi:membrane-associated phospholipid phosphatase